jgi:hypothetical protein
LGEVYIAAERGPDTYVDLMTQYYPAGLVGRDERARCCGDAMGPSGDGRVAGPTRPQCRLCCRSGRCARPRPAPPR